MNPMIHVCSANLPRTSKYYSDSRVRLRQVTRRSAYVWPPPGTCNGIKAWLILLDGDKRWHQADLAKTHILYERRRKCQWKDCFFPRQTDIDCKCTVFCGVCVGDWMSTCCTVPDCIQLSESDIIDLGRGRYFSPPLRFNENQAKERSHCLWIASRQSHSRYEAITQGNMGCFGRGGGGGAWGG